MVKAANETNPLYWRQIRQLCMVFCMMVLEGSTWVSPAPIKPQFCFFNMLLNQPGNTGLAYLESKYFLFFDQSPRFRPAPNLPTVLAPLNAGEIHNLEKLMRRRLPRYKSLFTKVAKEHTLDWYLLAAMSYQESHWHPQARSRTGVRGLMMLTLRTAKELGIRNRLDAEQSVRGGVRYLQILKKRLPSSIQEPDRTWQALAAYNIGLGHLYDARILTQKYGGNPDLWSHLRGFLPRLEDADWHEKTRFGYARGTESVQYVENILRYRDHIIGKLTEGKKQSTKTKTLPVMAQGESNSAKG